MHVCEPKAQVETRDSAARSSKEDGPNVERNLKCLRMERNESEKIFRKNNRDDLNTEYFIFCSYESYLYYK